MRQSLSLGFLLTLPCLNMYVNAFRSLDNPRNFRRDGFERGKRSLSAAILFQITFGDRKWARNGSLDASSLFGHIFYKTFCVGIALT